jgi:ligand-binding sensor domain-containing protein/signal transduction histidine kinase
MASSNKIVFLFFAIVGILSAQKNDLKFEHISIEEGLSQSTVHSIIQDNHGFIWIGTEDGLDRFDGYNFIVYRNDREDSNSIASNQIRAIIQDSNGTIWVGTENGLSALTLITHPQSGKKREGFHNYFSNPDDSNSISDDDIRCMYQDKYGVIWIGTSGGLNNIKTESTNQSGHYDFNKIKFSSTSFNSEFSQATSKTFISAITEDGNGNLWLGTMGKGLLVFNRESGLLSTYKNNPSDPKTVGSNYIIKLFTDLAGRVWVGTYGGGLNRFDYTSKSFIRYMTDPGNNESISENKVYGLVDDTDGNLWVGTFSGGLNKFDPNANLFIRYKNNEHNPLSLSNDFIRCLLIDRSDNLWVGTNNGINKTNLKHPKFITFRNNYWDPHSLSNNFVLSVFEDSNNKLWVGTNNGLDSYDSKSGVFINYKIPHNNPKSGDGFVYSILQDDGGFLWLGTFGGGLIKCNTDGQIIKHYLHNENNKNGILDNRINTLFLQKNGDIVVGTLAGICVLQKYSDKFRYNFISSLDSAQLSGKSIEKIYEDKNEIYWVGTNNGLFRIDPATGNCTEYLSDKDKLQTISNNTITAIYEDSKGNFWIGTEDGLNKLDRKTNTFTIFTTKNGLPNNYITSLIDDSEGSLWIATNRGISKLNIELPEGKQFRNYDTDDGLQGLEFNINASFKNKKGEIYFGGTNGLTKFNSGEIRDNPHLPEVAIISFYKMGKPDLSFLQISDTDNITLSYSENFFSFEFSAFDYTDSKKNQYAYQLEGFDKDWVYNNNRRFANYTSIDPGEYTFHVKASNNDGIWNESAASIKLIINPPFYRTWLAYIIYIIIGCISLYSIRKIELRKRKLKSEALLKEEKEKAKLVEAQLKAEKAELQAKSIESEKELEKQKIRYRIASDLHDEIGSNLSSITLLCSLMARNIKPDEEINIQLSEISNAARSSAESIRDIVWFLNPTSDLLGKLLTRMKETANLLLKNIKYNIDTIGIDSDRRINPEVKRNVYLIFKEALNNIAKHSGAGNIKIQIDNENQKLSILIADDGIGFDLNSVVEGNGLRNLNNRAEQIGAELKIISSRGKGTTISLKTDIA